MPTHSITDFISNFNGGTRVNRFRVTGTIGDGTILDDKGGSFHIRSASLPSSELGQIPINYRGRTVIYPGDRAYRPWEITVVDENPVNSKTGKTLYRAFHEWSNLINNHVSNTTIRTSPSEHFSNTSGYATRRAWTIEQLDVNGINYIRKFFIHNCWPVAVGPVVLDMGQDNVLASFSVVLAYSHYEFAAFS